MCGGDVACSCADLLFRLVVCNHQVVFHAKNPGDGIGLYAGDRFVGWAIHHAFQLNVSVVHNNADGRLRIDRVLL